MSGGVLSWPVIGRGLRALLGLRLPFRGVDAGPGLDLYGYPIVSMAPCSGIALGRKCSLVSVSEYAALGVQHACCSGRPSPKRRSVWAASSA